MVGASNAFNQVIEKDTDSLMKRTMNRPLPTGRMKPSMALFIAIAFTILGVAILYSINEKSALFGAISIFLYTSAYTPLKSVSPLVCIRWRYSWSNSFYVRLGCSNKSIWY